MKIPAAGFSPQPPPSTTSPTCPRRGASTVMRKCLRTTGPPHSQLCQCRTIRTSLRARPWKPVVMQLSNTELLNIIAEGKGDSQLGKDDPKLENDNPQSQPPSDPQFGLPGSPLTDPRLLESRNRHKARKAPPSKEKSSFQSKLLKNPFGMYAFTSIGVSLHPCSSCSCNPTTTLPAHKHPTPQLLPNSVRSTNKSQNWSAMASPKAPRRAPSHNQQ